MSSSSYELEAKDADLSEWDEQWRDLTVLKVILEAVPNSEGSGTIKDGKMLLHWFVRCFSFLHNKYPTLSCFIGE